MIHWMMPKIQLPIESDLRTYFISWIFVSIFSGKPCNAKTESYGSTKEWTTTWLCYFECIRTTQKGWWIFSFIQRNKSSIIENCAIFSITLSISIIFKYYIYLIFAKLQCISLFLDHLCFSSLLCTWFTTIEKRKYDCWKKSRYLDGIFLLLRRVFGQVHFNMRPFSFLFTSIVRRISSICRERIFLCARIVFIYDVHLSLCSHFSNRRSRQLICVRIHYLLFEFSQNFTHVYSNRNRINSSFFSFLRVIH